MKNQGTRIESLYHHCIEYSKICSTTPDRIKGTVKGTIVIIFVGTGRSGHTHCSNG